MRCHAGRMWWKKDFTPSYNKLKRDKYQQFTISVFYAVEILFSCFSLSYAILLFLAFETSHSGSNLKPHISFLSLDLGFCSHLLPAHVWSSWLQFACSVSLSRFLATSLPLIPRIQLHKQLSRIQHLQSLSLHSLILSNTYSPFLNTPNSITV